MVQTTESEYRYLTGLYWLAFLLTGDCGISAEIAVESLESMGGASRRTVIAKAIASLRDALLASAHRTESVEIDWSPVEPFAWSLESGPPADHLANALFAIDVLPRCALLLTVFEGQTLEQAALSLACGKDLVAKARMIGLFGLTRNLAATPGSSFLPLHQFSPVMVRRSRWARSQ
jgi:hypothetical protein